MTPEQQALATNISMPNPPICSKCKHYTQNTTLQIPFCLKAAKLDSSTKRVYFEWPDATPENMRELGQPCGPNGKLFEKRN